MKDMRQACVCARYSTTGTDPGVVYVADFYLSVHTVVYGNRNGSDLKFILRLLIDS